MSIQTFIKRLKDIMRGDAGVDGDAQRLSQIVWILFLRVFDIREEELSYTDENYQPIIPEGYRWRDWAAPLTEDGVVDVKNQMTGDELIEFVNTKLFPVLRGALVKLEDGTEKVVFTSTDERALIVKEFLNDANNYMKNGILLRQVINLFEEIDFTNNEEQHAFNDIYETLLKSLQSAGGSGEFYTPRAVTKFCVDHVNPQLGEKIADFACGTGGFLIDALNHIKAQAKTNEDLETVQTSLHGVEKKPLPYMLGTTNLLLHGINLPDIIYGNSLEQNVRDYNDDDKCDVILMNPPYGGKELQNIQSNFPNGLKSAETADLFMIEILYRLKKNGRVAVVLPDGFIFGSGNKSEIKKKLMSECNLHTVIRLPKSVFAPYTSITTNLLFFDKTGPTEETWFYRLDLPEGYKAFSKTKPMQRFHMNEIDEWWDNRVEIQDETTDSMKAQRVTYEEIEANNFDLSYCGYPVEQEVILKPDETIDEYVREREVYNEKIDKQLEIIKDLLGGSL